MHGCAIRDTDNQSNSVILACKECVYEICKMQHPKIKLVKDLSSND